MKTLLANFVLNLSARALTVEVRHDGLANVAASLAQHSNDLSRRLVVAARVDDDRTSGLLLRVRTRLQHLPLVVCSQK